MCACATWRNISIRKTCSDEMNLPVASYAEVLDGSFGEVESMADA